MEFLVQMVVSAVCLWSVFCRGYAATVNERCVQESRRMIMMETEERLEDIPLYSRWRVAARCCRKMQGVSTFPCNVRWKLPCVWVEGMKGVRRKSRRRQVRGQHTGDEGCCIDNLRKIGMSAPSLLVGSSWTSTYARVCMRLSNAASALETCSACFVSSQRVSTIGQGR